MPLSVAPFVHRRTALRGNPLSIDYALLLAFAPTHEGDRS
jgi:hypothetical protein